MTLPIAAPAIPLDEAGKYVAGAYIVFVVLILIYVAIMAAKLERIQRDIRDLADVAEKRRGEHQQAHIPQHDEVTADV